MFTLSIDVIVDVILMKKSYLHKRLCGCGKVLVVEPIERVDCVPRYKQSQPNQQQVKVQHRPENKTAIKFAIETLVALGWKAKKASNLVNQLSNSYSGDWNNFSEHVVRQVHAKHI